MEETRRDEAERLCGLGRAAMLRAYIIWHTLDGLGDVEFKSRDLGNDRGCRVADATEFVASRSVRLNLNPHPHKT